MKKRERSAFKYVVYVDKELRIRVGLVERELPRAKLYKRLNAAGLLHVFDAKFDRQAECDWLLRLLIELQEAMGVGQKPGPIDLIEEAVGQAILEVRKHPDKIRV